MTSETVQVHRIFSVLPPVCRKAPTAVAIHGRHQSPLWFHKGDGSRRPGDAGSYSPRTCCRRVPAAVSPGSIRQPAVLPVAGSGSVHCRTGLRMAMATTDRRWKRHTSGACVHGVRQHSGRVAATMRPGGGYRGRPVEERPGKGSRHWLYCRRHCRLRHHGAVRSALVPEHLHRRRGGQASRARFTIIIT
jgi:hypothetical protein